MPKIDPNILKKYGTYLKKYGVYAGIAVLVVIAIIIIYKVSKKFLVNEITAAQQEHIISKEIDQSQITLPQSEISNLVAKLRMAFGKWGYATDEKMVYEVMENLSNRNDYLALVSSFGVYKDHTLNEWLNKELNSKERAHIQEILSMKGIAMII